MPLNADNLLDRNHLKTLLARWRIAAICAIAVALIAVVERGNSDGIVLGEDYIARVSIEGVIGDDPALEDLFTDLEESDDVKAVIVRIDSPGGSAVGGEEIYLRMREIAEKKPVVAVMRTLATSAGYMAALGADRIYARAGTLTGSIGVLIQTAEVTRLADKLGIEPITVKSGELKGSPSPFEKLTPKGREMLQSVVSDFYRSFVQMIVDRRNLPKEKVIQLADGSVFTGTQAVEYKLIDAIGGEAEAVEWLVKEKGVNSELDVQDVKPKREVPEWLESLSETFSNAVFSATFGKKLDGISGIWQPNTL